MTTAKADDTTLEPGTVLRSTYVIEGRLAAGGMGEVYVARHVRLPGRFAVKVLSSRLLRDQDAVARFCRTLSTLLGSGVSILEALDITARTSGNAVVEEAILTTRTSIERGETIAQPLKETAMFPPMVVQMIGVGEATGRAIRATTVVIVLLDMLMTLLFWGGSSGVRISG